MTDAERYAAFLAWCEARSAHVEVFPGDVRNPRLSGWTARLQCYANPGACLGVITKRVDAGTPHGAIELLVRQVVP
jgi:hypothetical protein